MRWLIRTVAVLSVVSGIVVGGLFARPGLSSDELHQVPPKKSPATSNRLPRGWSSKLLAGSRDLFPGAGRGQAEAVLPLVERYAERFRVDPLLVLAVIQVESRFDPSAVSEQGAIGLMQLQGPTARGLAMDLDLQWTGDELLFDPELNVMLGCAYLRQLLDRFGDQDAVLAAYCSGPTLVEARLGVNGRIPLAYSDKVWDVLTSLQGRLAT